MHYIYDIIIGKESGGIYKDTAGSFIRINMVFWKCYDTKVIISYSSS